MAVSALFDADFSRYFAQTTDADERLWVFQHIPKTAGSSFRQALASRLRPDANVHANHRDPNQRPLDSLQAALDAFLGALPQRRYRFVSGHLRHGHIRQIREAVPGARLVTMLRDPVDRTVSDYRYMRTPAHPSYRAVIERYPSLAHYLDDPVTHNKMCRFLQRGPNESVPQLIERMEREYDFVGTQALYALSCRVLFRLLGDDGEHPAVHARRTSNTEDNRVDDLDALRPRIAACNAADQALYEHFAGRWAGILAPLETQLTSPPA